MSLQPTDIKRSLKLNPENLTLDHFLDEFNQVEIERLLYTLSALNDIGLEVVGNSVTLKTSITNLLRMLL